VALAGALTLVLTAAGCGGASDDSADSAGPTKAQFIKEGDVICQKSNVRESAGFKALEASNGSRQSTPMEELKVVVMPAVRNEIEEIGDLQAPPGEEDEVKAIVAAYEVAIERGERNLAGLLDGVDSRFTTAAELARSYGFKICGTD
jgi:hypothetical protein